MDPCAGNSAGSHGIEIDCWLRDGGIVVAASDRAARSLQDAFHRRRRAEGLTAWLAPAILDWAGFVRSEWEKRSLDNRMLLNPAQERAIWADIIRHEQQQLATALANPLHRLASMAMEAHELICAYAPEFLQEPSRAGWDQDAGAFSRWLSTFDGACAAASVLPPARLPLELLRALPSETHPRPAILAAGFDRLLPVQREIFNDWGEWREPVHSGAAADVCFFSAPDAARELHACARWCSAILEANSHARLLVVTQQIRARRGEIERAFLRLSAHGAAPLFEFTLGIPLSQAPLARAALLLLTWLDGSLEENAVDWLLSIGFAASGEQETAALQAWMRALRRNDLQRTEWTLAAFLGHSLHAEQPPAEWARRVSEARRMLITLEPRKLNPLDWAALVPQLLQIAGLPGSRALSSAEFQAFRRWEQAVDACGSLGFDNRRIGWSEFLATLARTLDETLFAPESINAPIQIAGPAESAGLSADAVWFLGADEDSWPAAGSTHPMLPLPVQRRLGMPHATPAGDWDLAQSITQRLLVSAPTVRFSFAAQSGETETRHSRLIAQLAGTPSPIPDELKPDPVGEPVTVPFADTTSVAFRPNEVPGGSAVLADQSRCPFKAFATARLDAKIWEPAEAGLTAKQRGSLLHEVLHAVWAGPPRGLRSLADLLALADVDAFINGHVQRVLQAKLPSAVRERMPARYLELEHARLARLVVEWLRYETRRCDFTVADTEVTQTVTIAGLQLKLRLDRIDRLSDASLLVVDYKSGDVNPKAWDPPRPEDVQLPLYAGFALGEEPGGLVFAKVRPGKTQFAGRVRDAKTTLLPDLSNSTALVKTPLTAEQMQAWRNYTEELAREFLSGRADVDPREYPATCEHCRLQSVCRVQDAENRARLETRGESELEEADDA